MGRASKDKRDIYYRKAKEEGYRARSAYKLLQIHEEYNILDKNKIRNGAVDLCAAPGSWSQVLAHHFQQVEAEEKLKRQNMQHAATNEECGEYVKPRIIAVDLQEMAPIEGVTILQGDITSEVTSRKIIELLNADHGSSTTTTDEKGLSKTKKERKADIVICDGAPDVTGMHELDEYLQHQLLLAALLITTCVLEEGGTFVTKMFRGPNTPFLVHKSEIFFEQVRVVKPKSSRNASMESFLLCQGFHLPFNYVPRLHLKLDTKTYTNYTADPEGTANETVQLNLQGACHNPAEAPLYHYRENDTDGADNNSNTNSNNGPARWIMPFLSCGDLSGFDSDMCYDRGTTASLPANTVLPPVQPPLQAPYMAPKPYGEPDIPMKKRKEDL